MDIITEEFKRLKNEVKELIKNKFEVKSDTKITVAGIYMIYLDHFDDNRIIPIYIGRSNNIQRRYKEHYCEILSLNRLSYDEYKKYNYLGIYDGSFKSCKIFKYMIDNKLTLKDFHFIVLECCLEEELDIKEQYYIEKFKSEYFGFNQLNLKTFYPSYIFYNRENNTLLYEKYIEIFLKNCNNIIKYYDYGFMKFNYNYAFPISSVFSPYSNEENRNKLNILLPEIERVNNYINSPLKLLQINNKETKDIIQKQRVVNKINREIRSFIFPDVKFSKYQLEDNYNFQTLKPNTIRFIISNNGKYKIADIIKIELFLNDKLNELYIENETTLNSQIVEYGEKNLYYKDLMQFKSKWFNIIPKNFAFNYFNKKASNNNRTSTYISVLGEYKSGLNDFSLKNKIFINLDDALLNILNDSKQIKKIEIICTESKSLLRDIIVRECSEKTINLIKENMKCFDFLYN